MKKTTLNPLENARRTAKGGSGAGASDITLSLGTNTGDDPVINLEYQEEGAVLSSPVAFDKEDFYIVNHHMRVEGLDTLKSDVDELDSKVSDLTDQLKALPIFEIVEAGTFGSNVTDTFQLGQKYFGYHLVTLLINNVDRDDNVNIKLVQFDSSNAHLTITRNSTSTYANANVKALLCKLS